MQWAVPLQAFCIAACNAESFPHCALDTAACLLEGL